MQQQRMASRRARLERLHTHGEKVSATLEAVALVVSGAVTFIGGLRALFDVVAPPPPKESDKD
jgi:hypothetical protein